MPDSMSKQIVVAALALIDGTGKPDALTTSRSRTIPQSTDDMPSVSAYRIEEDVTPVGGNQRRPTITQRHLILELAMTAAGGDDACDEIQQWVVSRMASDPTLGGLAKSVIEIKSAWEPDEGTSGETMTVFTRYRVEYLTLPGNLTQPIPLPGA